MAATVYNNYRAGCYLGEGEALNIVNEEITVASGAGKLRAGTVLGKITASGKFVLYDPALTNGAELAANAVILFDEVDATAADAKAVATVRGPRTINKNMLFYKAGMTAPQILAVNTGLRAKGIAVLPQRVGI